MTMTNPNDEFLDDVFAQARTEKVPPHEDLMARVLGDAAAVQSGFAAAPQVAQAGLWARLMEAIGGWPAVSGLAAATVAGVWIGVAPPSSVEGFTAGLIGDEVSVSLLPTSFTFETEALADG